MHGRSRVKRLPGLLLLTLALRPCRGVIASTARRFYFFILFPMANANESSSTRTPAHSAGPWKVEGTGDDGFITVITSPSGEVATIYYPSETESEERDAEDV